MQTIELTKGYKCIVDDEDYDYLTQYKWYASTEGVDLTYAVSSFHRMHRVIARRMGLDMSKNIDHIDRNPLNNTRSNLRSVTQIGNSSNKRKAHKCPFKGVVKNGKGWGARIQLPGNRSVWLGTFAKIEDAAKAYDEAAKQEFGEYACTNF